MMKLRKQQKIYFSIVLTGLLSSIIGCSDGETIEGLFSPDPNLNPTVEQKSETDNLPKPKDTPDIKESDRQIEKKSSTENLPTDWSQEIPLYPQGELQEVDSESTVEKGKGIWKSSDSQETIINYYQNLFKEEEWKIIQPFTKEDGNINTSAIASKYSLKVKVDLTRLEGSDDTEIKISYKPFLVGVTDSDNTLKQTEEKVTKKTESNISSSIDSFSDLEETPEQLKEFVSDLVKLEVLTPLITVNSKSIDAPLDVDKFAPNKPVTRRDYARWLVAANNKYYNNSPGRKIRLANTNSDRAFQDINPQDPDFPQIQGLAEAGLIPSMLTSNSNNVLFLPDTPLTREDLLIWKVPLDTRRALPEASLESIQKSWGFQDSNNVKSEALRALFADYQNGDRSNVRRVFGYTTLFQPKKAVTRAEAAASLWHFGFQADGITASDIVLQN